MRVWVPGSRPDIGGADAENAQSRKDTTHVGHCVYCSQRSVICSCRCVLSRSTFDIAQLHILLAFLFWHALHFCLGEARVSNADPAGPTNGEGQGSSKGKGSSTEEEREPSAEAAGDPRLEQDC